jgi:hypothetical protein
MASTSACSQRNRTNLEGNVAIVTNEIIPVDLLGLFGFKPNMDF